MEGLSHLHVLASDFMHFDAAGDVRYPILRPGHAAERLASGRVRVRRGPQLLHVRLPVHPAASEILESLVPVGGTTFSIAVAIAILIVLRPMQRFALRITDRLMNGVQNTPEYLGARKNIVYRAALKEPSRTAS